MNNKSKLLVTDTLYHSMDSRSDSDDDGIPSFLRAGVTFTCEDEDEGIETSSSSQLPDFCLRVEDLWLNKDLATLKHEYDSNENLTEIQRNCLEIAINILSGKFIHVVSKLFPASLQLDSLLDELINNAAAADSISRRVCAYISTGDGDFARELRSLQCMLLGTACLELYCQMNYTGPELPDRDLRVLYCSRPGEISQEIESSRIDLIHKSAINSLECDGDVAFPICVIPQALFVARVLLAVVADPSRATWKHGIKLSATGHVRKSLVTLLPDSRLLNSVQRLLSRHWRSARATVIHLRLLQKQSFEMMPTLWKECNDMFAATILSYGCVLLHSSVVSVNSIDEDSLAVVMACITAPVNDAVLPLQRLVAAELWIEIGLCHHFFEYKSKVCHHLSTSGMYR